MEIDESTIIKTPKFTIDVDESVLECKSFTPKIIEPLELNQVVMIPTSMENTVIATNHAESSGKPQIAVQKYAELCVFDYLSSKGIPCDFELNGILQTKNGFDLHIKATSLSDSLSFGPEFLINKDDTLNQHKPKSYVLGCLVSSDWKQVALLFCVSTVEARNFYRSPSKFAPSFRSLYYATMRDMEEKWGCLKNLFKQELKSAKMQYDSIKTSFET